MAYLIPYKKIYRYKTSLTLIIFITTIIFLVHYFKNPEKSSPSPQNYICHVPQLEPFNPAIRHLTSQAPRPLNCQNNPKYPLLFNSTLIPYPHLIPTRPLSEFKDILDVKKCHYQLITRNYNEDLPLLADKVYNLQATPKFPIHLDKPTIIPTDHEFIAITCVIGKLIIPKDKEYSAYRKIARDIIDVHAFVHDKPPPPDNPIIITRGPPSQDKLNVIVLGMDSISRMGFLRNMPLTHNYLINQLNAISFKAYHKIGDNTFPNIAPLLTNQKVLDGFTLACERKNNYTFDNCPFLWKLYKKMEYLTLFAEDESWLAIFNYFKDGFINKPTDYYLRPFTLAVDKLIGHEKRQFTNTCYGPRPAFQVLLDYLQKVSYVARKGHRKYFQFAWSSSVTHDIANGGQLLDKLLRDSLSWWDRNGYLNDTLIVLISDHGTRWGDLRNHYQGKLEDRLPFLYAVVPPWFQKRYPQAYQNLRGNEIRLVTPLDVYHTLVDVMDMDTIPNRKGNLGIGDDDGDLLTSGISLFTEIPKNRNCKMAGVPEAYCTCNHKVKELSPLSNLTNAAASFAVGIINGILEEFKECQKLSLAKILQIEQVSFDGEDVPEEKEEWNRYQLHFLTIPGYATFEAFLLWDGGSSGAEGHDNDGGSWSLSGQVERTNLYGNQSYCVDDKRAKMYCYCEGSGKDKHLSRRGRIFKNNLNIITN